MKSASLLAAEAEALLARKRLAHTADTLRARLEPRALTQEIGFRAYVRGEAAAQTGIAAARARPRVAAGVGIAAGLLLLRRPLLRGLSWLFRRRRNATGAATGSSNDTSFIGES